MSQENATHDIFISYRREGGFETARYLYDHLKWDGYLVTFDLDTLRMAEQHGSEDACFFIAMDYHGFLGEEPSSYAEWKEKLAAGRDDVEQLERKLKKARSWFARPVDNQSGDSVLMSACRLQMARIARLTGEEQEAKELYRQSAEDGNEDAAAELKEMEGGGAVKEGAVAGAAIGAVVPGVGSWVGAGIGAAFGWFKKRWGGK